MNLQTFGYLLDVVSIEQCSNGLVVSALGIRVHLLTLPPRFLSSKKPGYKKGVFGA